MKISRSMVASIPIPVLYHIAQNNFYWTKFHLTQLPLHCRNKIYFCPYSIKITIAAFLNRQCILRRLLCNMGLIGSMNIESQQSPDVYKSVIYTRTGLSSVLSWQTRERRAIETQEQRVAKLQWNFLCMHAESDRHYLPSRSSGEGSSLSMAANGRSTLHCQIEVTPTNFNTACA